MLNLLLSLIGWLENERSWTSSQLKEGDYGMEITVTDAAGNEAMFSHQFTVDTTPPTIVNFRYTYQYLCSFKRKRWSLLRMFEIIYCSTYAVCNRTIRNYYLLFAEVFHYINQILICPPQT